MTPVLLSSIAGVALSLLFAYVPGLRTRYGNLDGIRKRALMAGLLLIVADGSFLLSCYQPTTIIQGVTCSDAGLAELIGVYIAALVANQGAYSLAASTNG